jgi:hypothetical protein
MRPSFTGLALLLLALAATAPVHAQRFTGAIKVGLTSSAFDGETLIGDNFGAITRFGGGAAAGLDFENGFLAQVEILYVIKGGEGNSIDEDTEIPIWGQFDLTYIDIPLLGIYRFETLGRVQPKIFIGPTLSFKQEITARIRTRYTACGEGFGEDDICGPELAIEVADISSDRDFGLTVGAGFDVVVGDQRLTFDVRTTRGFTNLRDGSRELKNTALLFLLGLQF